MSELCDKVATGHMKVCLEQEEELHRARHGRHRATAAEAASRDGRPQCLSSLHSPGPLGAMNGVLLNAVNPCFLPLPEHVCQISPGPNYDFHSSIMRFIVSSPVMPDAVVDYNLSNAKWAIVQQENILLPRTQAL